MLAFHNQVQLIGRAGHAVELTTLSNGGFRATLRLYQNSRICGRVEETQFYTVVAWDAVAIQLHDRVRRGDRLMVQGKLQNRKISLRGETAYKTEIHLAFFTLLATRSLTRAVGIAAEPAVEKFAAR